MEIWNLAEWRSAATIPFPGVSIWYPAFSPDGRTLAVSARTPNRLADNRTQQVLLIDLSTGKVLRTLKDTGADNMIRTLRFSKNGRYLAVREGDPASGPVTAWDWRAGKPPTENRSQMFDDANPNISPDGRYELKR